MNNDTYDVLNWSPRNNNETYSTLVMISTNFNASYKTKKKMSVPKDMNKLW